MERPRQVWILAGVLASALALVASASARGGDAVGTLTLCNGTGNPPVPGVITFQLVAPASDGGMQVATLGPGACTGRYFLRQGLQLTVIENVPAGATLTNVTVSGASKIVQTALAAGTVIVSIGDVDSTLTFTTTAGGAPLPNPCVVPRTVGLTLAAARTAIKRAGCRVRSVSYLHSTRIPKGGVTSTRPRAGAHLAHGGLVRVYVSRG